MRSKMQRVRWEPRDRLVVLFLGRAGKKSPKSAK